MFCQLTRKYVCLFTFIVIVGKYEANGNGNTDQTAIVDGKDEYTKAYPTYVTIKPTEKYPEPECWIDLKVQQIFNALDTLEEKYRELREDFLKSAKKGQFNDKMFDAIVNNVVERRRYSGGENINILPADINLGGYSIVKLSDSFIFFHRMKLMYDTHLRVNFLHNDLTNNLLTARFSVPSLRLTGSYERARSNGPYSFVYKPNVGNIELKFTNVIYKVEGRYRLVQHHWHVQHVNSELSAGDMDITFYKNGKPEPPVSQWRSVSDTYIAQMKIDMDVYIKDYLNNHLRPFNITKYSSNITELQNYEQEKALILNEWVNQSLSQLRARTHRLKVSAVKEPNFDIYSPEGMIFKLKNGVLRGLDSFHRRSVATVRREGSILHVNVILGFSTLLLKYEYEAMMQIGNIPDKGALMLNADALTAHMRITMVPEPETSDVQFQFYKQAKSEYLVIGGDINRKLPNYKHLIQNQVLQLMTTSILTTVTGLKYLTKCHSTNVLTSHSDHGEMHLMDDDSDHGNVTPVSNDTEDQQAITVDSSTHKISTEKNIKTAFFMEHFQASEL